MKPEHSVWLSSLSSEEEDWETDAVNSSVYIESLKTEQDFITFDAELEALTKMKVPHMTLLFVTRAGHRFRVACPNWYKLLSVTRVAICKAKKDPRTLLRGLRPLEFPAEV